MSVAHADITQWVTSDKGEQQGDQKKKKKKLLHHFSM